MCNSIEWDDLIININPTIAASMVLKMNLMILKRYKIIINNIN